MISVDTGHVVRQNRFFWPLHFWDFIEIDILDTNL